MFEQRGDLGKTHMAAIFTVISIEQLLRFIGLSWQVVKLIRPKKADKVWIAPELQAKVL